MWPKFYEQKRHPLGKIWLFSSLELYCVNKMTQLCALHHRWFEHDHTWQLLHTSLNFLWGGARLWHCQWMRQLGLFVVREMKSPPGVTKQNDDFLDLVWFLGILMAFFFFFNGLKCSFNCYFYIGEKLDALPNNALIKVYTCYTR